MIALLSAAVGYVAFQIYLKLNARRGWRFTETTLLAFGAAMALTYGALAWDKIPGDTYTKIGWLMLSLMIFMIATSIQRCLDTASDLNIVKAFLARRGRS